MSNVKFLDEIERIKNLDGFKNSNWQSINPDFVARMSLQVYPSNGIVARVS